MFLQTQKKTLNTFKLNSIHSLLLPKLNNMDNHRNVKCKKNSFSNQSIYNFKYYPENRQTP